MPSSPFQRDYIWTMLLGRSCSASSWCLVRVTSSVSKVLGPSIHIILIKWLRLKVTQSLNKKLLKNSKSKK
jgi:hypothetical protein